MLSKAKGQVLRVAASLHILMSDHHHEVDGTIIVSEVPNVISKEAIIAAQNFVNTCCQHAAYISGRGKIEDEIEKISTAAGMYNYF